MDHIRALNTFIAVAENGSFSGAAQKMRVSAPSVTRVIGELEQDLGALLLHRTTRAVSLTETGRAFLEDARKIVQTFDDARSAVRGTYQNPTGTLRVTAPVLFGQHYVTPILLQFIDQYPDITVEATFVDRMVNIVEEGCDVAVRIGALADSSLMATRVGTVRRVVCACPDFFEQNGMPATPSDLNDFNIIAARAVEQAHVWRFKDGMTVRIVPRMYVNHVGAAIEGAKTGWGLTRVLSYQIGPEIGSGGLQTVLQDFEPDDIPIHIVHTEGRSASAKVRTFVDFASERLRSDAFLN